MNGMKLICEPLNSQWNEIKENTIKIEYIEHRSMLT